MAQSHKVLTDIVQPRWAQPASRLEAQFETKETDRVEYTDRNIEDWDFRDVEPGSEAAEFRRRHYSRLLVIEGLRSLTIRHVLELGYATFSEDGKYIVVLPGFYEQQFKRFVSSMSLRDLVTPTGRRYRRIRQSLWREWEKYGRVKTRVMRPIQPAELEVLDTRESGVTCEHCGRDTEPVEHVEVRYESSPAVSFWRCRDRAACEDESRRRRAERGHG